jgi:hypothetical protein
LPQVDGARRKAGKRKRNVGKRSALFTEYSNWKIMVKQIAFVLAFLRWLFLIDAKIKVLWAQ